MPNTSKLNKNNYLVLGILGLITLWLSLDGKHYWHEIRFMYGATQFSMEEILSGIFNPHQVGGNIDEIGAGGFYLAKVLHVWLLKVLFSWIPPDKGGFSLSVFSSVFLMGVSAIIIYKIFCSLFNDSFQAFLSACCFLMIPITPYLAGKILSEVPAIFFMALCILSFNIGVLKEKSPNWFYIGTGGVFLLCAGLSRLDIILCFYGYLVALYIFHEKEKRNKIIKAGGIASIIFIMGELGVIYSLGKGLHYFTSYFNGFINAGQKSRIMSLVGILTFGGVIYLLAFAAIFNKEKKKILLLAIWFFISTGIAISITWHYMVEPRYLVSGLLPLIGLASLGLENILQKISGNKLNTVYVGVFIISVTILNVINVKLMPFELDRHKMVQAVNKIFLFDKSSTILIPWAYTDFHFLHVMFPDANIINVHSKHGGKEGYLDNKWEGRLKKWYGNTYVQSPILLNKIFKKGPVYYLGWEKYPPAESAKKILRFLGFEKIPKYINNLPFMNHLIESWVWQFPGYHFKLIGTCGQYKYFKVDQGE